jgi:hypothetical protein
VQHASITVAELDPSHLLQPEGVDCAAAPIGEPSERVPAKRTAGE